ncbi:MULTISPECIES: alpha/beta fold hydrolase [unclassified Massilia]|uniref:alpha/beta fold hydrolase n=1 Tax=unclassified Massilia TaxID=2609279 RepID=UPI001782D3B4|nr:MULTISPECIES: alpha/beta fold hydrolase [unclassified Massilia]MBD8531803.1 alpha/beta fold hydrolase [Massilia sp. CFBP 13647]MBD8675248.1 alpha/beta fold hydrolase [Massilia sp. CFBP 13721]
MRQESLQLMVNGLRLHVQSVGQGPAVVLLHGFPDTHVVWRKQVAPLVAAGYRVLAPDLRGYGGSDAPLAIDAYRLKHVCADVLAMLDALAIPRARIVGHDWGAVVGWLLCMRAPERIEQFAALSVGHPAAFARAGILQALRSSYMMWFLVPGLAERSLMAGDFYLMSRFTKDRAQVGHWKRSFRDASRMTAALNYYRANVPRGLGLLSQDEPVQVPVMGVWSSNDPALGETQMRASARYVAGGFRYERIDGADHWLQVTAPDQVNALLLDFFAGAPQSAAPASPL